jgi:hypothetical protein
MEKSIQYYRSKLLEELKGDQHKIDADKDGEITSKDFEMLRSKNEGHEGQDHEVSMAVNSLKSIISSASQLMDKIGQEEKDLPAWIQDHITNAENYISHANKNYHEYGEEDQEEYTDGGEEDFGDYDQYSDEETY